MDRITNTANNAFIGYFNMLRRKGGVSLSERYKLMLLWYFNYLKTDSDFLEYYDDEDEELHQWKHDYKLEKEVNAVFDRTIKCLSVDTCNIRLMDGDCTSLPQATWFTQSEPVEKIYLLALNDTDPIGDSSINPENMSFQDAMVNEIWSEQSGFIVQNAEPESEEERVYFSYEHNLNNR